MLLEQRENRNVTTEGHLATLQDEGLLVLPPHDFLSALNPIDSPDLLEVSLLPHELASTKTPEFQRLDAIKQMESYYTSNGKNLIHTRSDHALACVSTAERYAQRLGLSNDVRLALRFLALHHDDGHTPFGHLGEDIFRVFFRGFDHDINGLKVLRGSKILDCAQAGGVDPDLILRAQDDFNMSDPQARFLRYIVKELVDRSTYARMDCLGLGFSERTLRGIFAALDNYEASVFLDPATRRVCLDSIDPARGQLAARSVILQEAGKHPSKLLLQSVLVGEARNQLLSGRFNVRAWENFPNMTDEEALGELFPRRIQQQIHLGLEKSFHCVRAWKFSDLTSDALHLLGESRSKAKLKQRILEDLNVDASELHVCTTPDYSKSLKVTRRVASSSDDLKKTTLTRNVSHDKRFLFIALSNDSDSYIKAQRSVDTMMTSNGYLKDRAPHILHDELFDHTEQSLFIG